MSGGTISYTTVRTGIVTLFTSVFLTGCILNNSPTLTGPVDATDPGNSVVDSLATVDPASVDRGLKDEYAEVERAAKEWDAGAKLYAITINWPATLASGNSQRVYVFGSSTNEQVWWTLAINEQTHKRLRSLIPRSDYLGTDLDPVATQYWQINAVTALQAAEAAGGKEFREQNITGIQVTTSLIDQGPKGWLWWVVNYRVAQDYVKYYVDPKTGQVYDEDGEPLASTNG